MDPQFFVPPRPAGGGVPPEDFDGLPNAPGDNYENVVALVQMILGLENREDYEAFVLKGDDEGAVMDEDAFLRAAQAGPAPTDLRQFTRANIIDGLRADTVRMENGFWSRVLAATLPVITVLGPKVGYCDLDPEQWALALAADRTTRILFAEFVVAESNLRLAVATNTTNTRAELLTVIGWRKAKIRELERHADRVADALDGVTGGQFRLRLA